MSFDRKIDQVCAHRVVEEALFVATDRRTVRPLRPVSSITSLSMRINGVIDVPAIGVQVPAEATFPHRGAINIARGSNDTLIVDIDKRSTRTLTVSAGSGVNHRQIAEELNSGLQNDAVFTVTKRGLLKLTTRRKGPAAELMFKDGSTLATALGLPLNRAWKGKTPYPSWSVIQDPNTLSDRPTRMVVFDERVKGSGDYVELSYSTVRQECRRCQGLGVENDWRYGANGDTIEVRNEALLIQEVLKIMFTIQGSNTFHTWYGTNINNTVARKIVSSSILQNFIVSDIYEAFRRWQTIKKQQESDVGQFVSDEEYPLRMLAVTVEQSERDPTIVFVSGEIQNRSSQPIQIERGVKLPEPIDLLGATAQQGVYRQSLSDYTLTG